MTNRLKLEKALEKINWKIVKSGNGLNDFIINHEGKKTQFRLYNEKIEVCVDLFGEASNGLLIFDLKLIKISYTRLKKQSPICAVHLGVNRSGLAFISFYNHTK